jgi:hypothetical protein
MPYDTPTDYTEYDAIPADCGCAVKGLIEIKDCDGSAVAYLTPNDAELYKIGTIEPEYNYVKVFHPTTNVFLGILTVEEAMVYITYLNSLP